MVETIHVDRDELRQMGTAVISGGLNIEVDQAAQIIDQFEYAELSGKRTHGFVRIPWLLKQGLSGHESLDITPNATAPVQYVDCTRAVGYLAANEIASQVRHGLRSHPIQAVVARNIFPTNTLGYYLQNLVEDGDTVGVLFGTTPKLATTPDTTGRSIGTNPLAIGFKHEGTKVISDITTVSTSLGALLVAKYWGGFEPANYRTADGLVPEDITALYEGDKFTGSIAQRLEGQADRRLFSVAVVIQALSGLIAGTENNRGNLTILGIRKDVFSEGVAAGNEMLPPGLGVELLPGMRSHLKYQEASARPDVELPVTLWNEIATLAQ